MDQKDIVIIVGLVIVILIIILMIQQNRQYFVPEFFEHEQFSQFPEDYDDDDYVDHVTYDGMNADELRHATAINAFEATPSGEKI